MRIHRFGESSFLYPLRFFFIPCFSASSIAYFSISLFEMLSVHFIIPPHCASVDISRLLLGENLVIVCAHPNREHLCNISMAQRITSGKGCSRLAVKTFCIGAENRANVRSVCLALFLQCFFNTK
jgi:hypothetical protein